jgi:hypothetical protein
MIVYKGLLSEPDILHFRYFILLLIFILCKGYFIVIKQDTLLLVSVGQTLQKLIVALINWLFATMHI